MSRQALIWGIMDGAALYGVLLNPEGDFFPCNALS